MRLPAILCLAVGMAALNPAAAAPAHEHGAASLDLALEGEMLSIALESPLDNLVGFEHAPKTPQQRDAVKRMEASLRAGEALFRTTPEAGCKLADAVVEPPFGAAGKPTAADGHAEASARWTFRCARPDALKSVDVLLFEPFAGIRRLKVQMATPRGQSAATLSAKKRTLAW